MRIGNLTITWRAKAEMAKEPAPAPAPLCKWKSCDGADVYSDNPPAFVLLPKPRYVIAVACGNYHMHDVPAGLKFEPGPLSICTYCGKRVHWCVAEETLEQRPEYWCNRSPRSGCDSLMTRVKERRFHRWVK